jgi:hypothetical protein
MNDVASWNGFAAFRLFAQQVPAGDDRLVMRLSVVPLHVEQLLSERAVDASALDPELSKAIVRAGLALARVPDVRFVYANTEEAVVLVEPGAVGRPGRALAVHDELISTFAGRLALLLGREVAVQSHVYGLPDAEAVRKAFSSALEAVEEATPARCTARLVAQMQGRGEPFHPSMVETLEEQVQLLEERGVDLERLPAWWWRGVAARPGADGVELFDELPQADEFARLVPA